MHIYSDPPGTVRLHSPRGARCLILHPGDREVSWDQAWITDLDVENCCDNHFEKKKKKSYSSAHLFLFIQHMEGNNTHLLITNGFS